MASNSDSYARSAMLLVVLFLRHFPYPTTDWLLASAVWIVRVVCNG